MTATCENCGTTVSDRFAKVLGDNEDRVRGCPSCSRPGVEAHLRSTVPPRDLTLAFLYWSGIA
jgi:hypothetical protein